MSKITMMLSFKCCNHCEMVFDHLRLSFNAVNIVFMRKTGIKYQYVSQCALIHVLGNDQGVPLCEHVG